VSGWAITTDGDSQRLSRAIAPRVRRVAGTLTYYKNGVSQGICFNGVVGPLYPAICFYSSSRTVTVTRCEELAITEPATPVAGGVALPCFDLLESRCATPPHKHALRMAHFTRPPLRACPAQFVV